MEITEKKEMEPKKEDALRKEEELQDKEGEESEEENEVEGRGFCAGVDIKEMQALDDHQGILEANRSCYEAFRAVYECAVPVVAAVNGYCLGSGVGLAGNADVVLASADRRSKSPAADVRAPTASGGSQSGRHSRAVRSI